MANIKYSVFYNDFLMKMFMFTYVGHALFWYQESCNSTGTDSGY